MKEDPNRFMKNEIFCKMLAQLVELFGSARDHWIKEDLAGWLAPNHIYEGVPAVLNQLLQREEAYIVTTKQASGLSTLHLQARRYQQITVHLFELGCNVHSFKATTTWTCWCCTCLPPST